MRMKRIVQTGAKRQLGGLNEGLFKVAYQLGIEGVVKIEPIIPAKRQSEMEISNCQKFLRFIF